ncbi:hypothetical protein HYPSUDRAFT_80921 [Hypholoma sublateritium FD-334 SS-4]|uniref:Uncharacterized protein n=1 Tax=Hypholoma sublateritium (strain FD-334 SS-4) TaxID=945553 RepID=A0A0D2P0H8_HYPSF|nr:hypothetical protein HYPSUDRAFT_80921 [Hypholoma sublateritium FD-334 SS-4]
MPSTHEPHSQRTILRRVPASPPDAGKKTLERSRTRSSPSLASNAAASSSASSSSTSLPRTILPAARSGTFGPIETHRRRTEQSEPAMSSTEQSSRPRTLSASSSGHSHGRQSVKARPPTPGSGHGVVHPSVPSAPYAKPQPALRAHSYSAGTPSRGPQLNSEPAQNSRIPHRTTSSGLTGINTPSSPPNATPSRRPSLASPLPATPIIPSHLPKAAVRAAPAPLNLTPPGGTPLRHHFHTGSVSSPHSSQPSPGYNAHSATPPHSATVNQAQQAWTSHAQYINVPRGPANVGTSGSLPDSPSTRAMMRRLLSKPAPISPAHRIFGGTSGSESDSQIRQRMRFRSSSPHSRVRAVKTDGEEDKYAPGGIEFDMDLGVLDRTIATLGQWTNPSKEQVVSSAGPPQEAKEKEREKRPRNVLRRRPSTNTQSPSSSKSSLQTPVAPAQARRPSISAPHLSTPQHIPSPAPRNAHIPPLAAFPPLGISPPSQPHAAEIGAPQPNRGAPKNMHRSASASAALPASGRIPRVHTAPQVLHPHLPAHHQQDQQDRSPHHPSHPPLSPGDRQVFTSPHSIQPQPLQAATAARHQYPRMRPQGARSPTGSPGSSHGSSQLSPIVSGLVVPGGPASPAPASPALSSSSKRMSTSAKPTPAASVVEAYQKQERAREERRRAAEVERAQMRREAERGDGSGAMALRGAAPPELRAHSFPGPRRDSVSGLDALVEEKQRSDVSEHGRLLGAGGGPAGSTVTVDTLASVQTFDSGPRIYDDESMSDGGKGFATIARIVGGPSQTTGVPQRKLVKSISMGSPLISKQVQNDVDEEEDVSPYYTVLGSSSTRVAAGASPDVGWTPAFGPGHWEVDVLGRSTTIAGGGLAKEKDGKAKESLGRTLSRKVSGRWRKQGGAVVDTVADGERQMRMATAERISMQERRKTGGPMRRDNLGDEQLATMHKRRSLRLSIDKFSDFVDEQPPVPSLAKHVTARNAMAASTNPTQHDPLNDVAVERQEKKTDKMKKVEASPTGSQASGTTSKFWKLMRRISVGGLKEKYHDTSPPPPVPALPKDLQSSFPPLQASSSNESFRKNIHASRSQELSEPRKNRAVSVSPIAFAPTSQIPRHRKSSTVIVPSSSTQSRPSTTTVSSSPVSSDIASAKFFHLPRSNNSSTSSFNDHQVPPLPSKLLQHIVPPSELDKSYVQESQATSPRTRGISESTHRAPFMDEDWSIVPSPSVELPSLPFPPPRRPVTAPAGQPADDGTPGRSESPTIPSFSNTAAVNAFPARRLSAALSAKSRNSPSSPYPTSPASPLPSAGLPVTPTAPPPRPLRSAQRPTTAPTRAAIFEEPLHPNPTIVVNDMSTGRRSESHARHRRSSGELSGTSTGTTRPRRRSSSFGATTRSSIISSRRSVSPPPGAPAGDTTVVFRELDGARPRQPLTEVEKAARWDDLLERSARAGGTLHLAGGARMLPSDNMRPSRS